MSKEPEALRLAEWWEQQGHNHALTPESKTAAELRRLHEVNVTFLAALTFIAGCDLNGADHVVKGYIAHVLIDKACKTIAKAEGDTQ